MSTILIAYERETEQNALEKILSERGHIVVRANNGIDALESARRDPPQLIISDISLPKMDGFALCRKWKQDDRLQSVPFVFYTRRDDDPKYRRFATELSADRFIERSTDRTSLIQAIDELLLPGVTARQLDPVQLLALSTGAFLTTTRVAAVTDFVSTATVAAAPAAVVAPVTIPASVPNIATAAAAPISSENRLVAREARVMARATELDALNKQLQASEQQFRQLFEANPIAIWLLSTDERNCLAVNNAALALYGYTQDEFLNLSHTEPPFVPGAAIPGSGATWHRTRSGSAIAVELFTRVVELGSRHAEIVVAYDVTQRVFSDRANAQAGDAYQALLIAAGDGFWLLDNEQRLLDVNQAYSRMSGYSRDELLKLSAADLETKIGTEPAIRLRQEMVDQNIYESMHRRKNGELYPVEVSVGALTGARPRVVVIVRDISAKQQQAKMAELLTKAQQAALELFSQAANRSESEILKRTTELIAEVTSSPLAFLGLTGASHATPMLIAVYERADGTSRAVTEDAQNLRANGPSAECVRRGQPLLSNEGLHSETSDALPTQQTLLLVPVIHAGEALGVVAVANRDAHYNNMDKDLLSPIVDALASILMTKNKQVQTLSAARRADAALQGVIESLRYIERK